MKRLSEITGMKKNAFWLDQEIQGAVIVKHHRRMGCPAESDDSGHYIFDETNPEVLALIREAVIAAVTNSTEVYPPWDSLSAKQGLLKDFQLSPQEKHKLMAACSKQAELYEQRALEWLVSESNLASFKQQVIRWLEDKEAGRRTHAEPLSKKQVAWLLQHVFDEHPDFIAPTQPAEPERKYTKSIDPWTGETVWTKVRRAVPVIPQPQLIMIPLPDWMNDLVDQKCTGDAPVRSGQ
jgi:hypothetical protein